MDALPSSISTGWRKLASPLQGRVHGGRHCGWMRSGAPDTCHSLWSVSGSQQQINKISFLLPFTCRGSSPSCRSFSQLAPALWPLWLLWEMRSPGSWRVNQCQGENKEKLQTQDCVERRQLHFRQIGKRLPRVSKKFWCTIRREMTTKQLKTNHVQAVDAKQSNVSLFYLDVCSTKNYFEKNKNKKFKWPKLKSRFCVSWL